VPSSEPTRATQKSLQARLDEAYIDDLCKPACTLYATLGKQMVERLDLTGHVLVLSDLGLLAAVLIHRREKRVATGTVTFVCHTEKVATFTRSLGVEPIFVPYDGLDLFFTGHENIIFRGTLNRKFDVLIGNPPFNPPKSGDGRKEGSKIWQKFIERAFELAADDGHLLFVTPHNWRQGNFKPRSLHRQAQSLMFDSKIKWWMDTREPVDHFPMLGDTSVDAWHVIKGQKNELHEVLQKLCLLPKSSDPETLAKVAKFYEVCMREEPIEKQARLRGWASIPSDTEPDGHPYPLANTSAQVKKGRFNWSAEKPPHFESKKVLVSDSGAFVIGYDDGKCSVGEHTAAYIVSSKQEGDRVVEFLQSPLVKFVAEQFMKPGALGFPMELFERVPKAILTKPWEEVFR